MRHASQNPRRKLTRRQRGGVLIASLIILLAFTLIVLGSSQHILAEQRISSNQSDRQRAFQLAQMALGYGEQDVSKNGQAWQASDFAPDCGTAGKAGLCSKDEGGSSPRPAWERTQGSPSFPVLHPCGKGREYAPGQSGSAGVCSNGKVTPGSLVWANPRYIIELLDPAYSDARSISGRLYRITARAWGKNENTQVTLQSHFVVPNN